MTSSMSAGERRRASARRGGMTVLGKVSVPKPLNLPSQRLESHGLDPNVEIVPKGTLGWGSLSSSSASNAWGSSTLSPSHDGGTGSPSHLSGPPSSGGSCNRPSTAGSTSDRMHESSVNLWGPNSRPSSASGDLTLNQTSLTSLRPHSAENRPGSSQLSRFAEPSSDNAVACGPTGAARKLGVSSSRNDGFSLSSRDFPTLGSERDNSGKNMESQDRGSHGRPSSSSGRVRLENSQAGFLSFGADVKNGAANAWKRDGSQQIEDGVQPNVEKWQGDSQPYPNFSPQQFDAWRGPPINAPGVWYRGPPRGPPYGAPISPGDFPIEPFPFYRPQIPHLVPPVGSGPRGHHPANGDLYRPQMPDAYIHQGMRMPMRPGFYPGPPYEGYYGPPMGHCGPNERDIPFMGMAAGPSVYNRYPAQHAPDRNNDRATVGGHVSTARPLASEQLETGHSDDAKGLHKVLLKQHNEWDGKEEENWQHTVPTNARSLGKGDHPRALSQKSEWGTYQRRDEEMHTQRTMTVGENYSRTFDSRETYSSESVKVIMPESRAHTRSVDDSWVKKPEISPSSSPEVPQVFPAAQKGSTLIHRSNSLNAKAGASDGQHDVAFTSNREEQKNILVDVKARNSTNEAGISTSERAHATGNLIPASHKAGVSRIAYHGVQGGVDHQVKGRPNTRDADRWGKKYLATDSSGSVWAASSEPTSQVHAQDHHYSMEVADESQTKPPAKNEGQSLTPICNPSDSQMQRAKMRELAKQRAMQLQEEEEKRMREQKAKALAKLEELNRRRRAGDGSSQKLEKDLSIVIIQQEQGESLTLAEPVMVATKCEAPSLDLVSNSDLVIQNCEGSTSGVGESTVLSKDSILEAPKIVQMEPAITHVESLSLKQEADNAGAAGSLSTSQVNDGVVPRHKHMSYKQRHNMSLERKMTEKSTSTKETEAPENQTDLVANDVAADVPIEVVQSGESSLPNNSNAMAQSSAHQRRKNSRSVKNKHKLDDVSSAAALSSLVSKETNPAKAPTDCVKAKFSRVESDPCPLQSVTDAKDAIQSSELLLSLPSDEAHGRVNNLWKSQHSRKIPRNPQVNRPADKFHSSDAVIWVPVRSQNNVEVTDGVVQKTLPDVLTPTSKSGITVQNNTKSKRAELERYVPKPVAKELAQQGSIPQPVPPTFCQTTSDEMSGNLQPGFHSNERCQPASCAIGYVESPLEPGIGDGKQNKQAKTHGAWRQRGSIESSRVQGLQSSSMSNPSKNIDKTMEQQQSLKNDENIVKAQPMFSDEWNTSDGWNTPETSDATRPITAPVVKDRGATGKGKRQPFKGRRSTGIYHELDHKNMDCKEAEKSYIQSAFNEVSQSNEIVALKENRGAGDRTTTYWQPKSLAYAANTQLGSRSSGAHHVIAEVGRAMKKDSPLQCRPGRVRPTQNDKDSIEDVTQPLPDQSVPENKVAAGESNVGHHQEAKREKKADSSKERPYSPNQVPFSTDDQAPVNIDTRNEPIFSTGFRKHGNLNNYSGRGHESRRDWSSTEKDNRQHNVPANQDRHRHNTHYEYQLVRPNNNSKSNNFEGSRDGSHNVGSRYTAKGQSQSRRGGGNFYGRQSGTVRVDTGYD